MYRKILVPLDGSKLAECVFPHVEALIQGCQAKEIVFIRVVEPISLLVTGEYIPAAVDIEQLLSSMTAEAEGYLKALVQGFKRDGADLKWEVKSGRVVEILVDYAVDHGIDLIVIATHGRSGVSRWVWGSVADRVLRSSCVPVLMVRAPGCVPGI